MSPDGGSLESSTCVTRWLKNLRSRGTSLSGKPAPRRGADVITTTTLSFREAATGVRLDLRLADASTLLGASEQCSCRGGHGSPSNVRCSICDHAGNTRTVNIRIPPGVSSGQRFRLRAQGEPGLAGGPPGDLIVSVQVAPDSVFGRVGDHLTVVMPLSPSELASGTTQSVPTLNDPITVRVPAGIRNGQILRVPGIGLPSRDGRGDLLITCKVSVPMRDH